MDSDYASVGLVGLGLAWFVNPLYWPLLQGTGLAAGVDWLGAIGLVPAGSYYVGLGAAYMVAGLAGFWYARDGLPFRRAVGVALVGLVPMLLGVLGSYTLRYGTTGLTSITLALGIGPALVALPLGVADTGRERRLALGVAVALLLPYAGWILVNAGVPPRGMQNVFAYLSVGLLALLDAIWGLPLYWLGGQVATGTD